jgi:dienelactone hydrolase
LCNKASYESFSEDDFNDMVIDVKAAKEFLISKNLDPDNVSIVGASIGANVALNYAASNPTIESIVLLSPGLNYKGVSTTETIKQYNGPIYIAVTSGDGSADDSRVLCDEINCGENLIYKGSNSHGTDMFSESLDPQLVDIVVSWL